MNILAKIGIFLFSFLIVSLSINLPLDGKSASNKLVYDYSHQWMADYRSAIGLFWRGDYSSAERAFQKLLQHDPDNASGIIFLADCQQAQGKRRQAVKNYEKAYLILKKKSELRKDIVPDAKEPEIYADLAYSLNAMGRYDDAKQIGMLGIFEGESPDLYVNMAYTFLKLGQTEIAYENFCKSQLLTDPRELNNLTYQRLNILFEKGRGWITCPDEESTGPKGINYALIIAVGKYKDSKIVPLNFVENDVRELYRVITDPRTGIFQPENVTVLVNKDATEKNIKFKFDDMVGKAKQKEDMFFVFYAGHGFTYPNGTDTYWLTYDTIVGDREGNRIKSTAFSNLTLATKLRDIQANTIVFFVDACFSAGMVNRPAAIRGLETYLGTDKDYVIITSSQADQLSLELARLKHGLFSYFLIKGLSGEADINSDGWVDIEEVWPFIKSRVSERALIIGAEQDPRRSGSSGRSIYISKNPNF
jgi:tetratricopeptide (TPR) repeat protein